MGRTTAERGPGQTTAHAPLPPGTEDLGQLRETFVPKRWGAMRVLSGVLMTIVFLFLGVLPGLYFLWLLMKTPNLSRRQAARRLHLFEHGLAEVARNGKVSVFRWDSTTALQEITRRYANGIYVGTTYVYTLYRQDGSTLKLTDFYAEPDRWGPALQQEITRAQLPGLLAGLEEGRTLVYGDLSVNRGGVATAKGSVAWHEIEDMKIADGTLVLRKFGKKLPWSSVPVRKIPNFFLFLALVDQLHSGSVGRQG